VVAGGGVDVAFGAVGTWASVGLPWDDDRRDKQSNSNQSLDVDDEDDEDAIRRSERRAHRRRRATAADASTTRDGPWGVHVKTSDMCSVQPCAECSLPAGFGFHVGMTDGTGAYFVCDDAAGRERWVDALTLVRHVAARGRGDALMAELTSDVTVAPQLRNKGRGR